MKCAIMQPSYLPWAGYFNLMSKVDIFIFLDDAQFSKNNWHNRNLIICNNEKKWLTIPLKKSSINTKINEKQIDNSKNWIQNHQKTILQNYSSHPFENDLQEFLFFFKKINSNYLADFNIKILKYFAKKFFLNPKFLLSSELNIDEKRTTRLIKILEKIKATEYLSPEGAKSYLESDNFNNLTSIKLSFNNYKDKIYSQKNLKNFTPNLSIIDIVANLGWTGTSSYVIK